ncbi:hypothetical protein KBI33_03470 [Candidatus Shapirobacteria bacterium]|nr:hypothetical protein [Candidatus Shapirobacteria bacterium]
MKKKKIKRIVHIILSGALILILLFFRFYKLGQLPPGIMVDEVAIGYNAYSIFKTGQDEWGERFPLVFKSFGDNKPPGSEYFIAFLLNFLPLNTFVTRLPSALGGIAAVAALGYFFLKIFPQKKYLSLLAVAIAGFSPWGFQVSRLYFESNVALGFFLWGVVQLLVFLEEFKTKQEKILNIKTISGLIFLAFSGYFYAAYRVVGALIAGSFLLLILWQERKNFSKTFKQVFILGLVFLLAGLPMFWQLFFPAGSQRLEQESQRIVFGHALIIDNVRQNCYLSTFKNPWKTKVCYIFWNKPILRIEGIAKNFIAHFGFDFLFLKGDIDQKNVSPEGWGSFYLFLLPFFLLGIVSLFRRTFKKKEKWAILSLLSLFFAPIPASLVGNPVSQRSLPLWPFLMITIILGVEYFLTFLKKREGQNLAVFLLFFLLAFTSLRYLINYFWVYTQTNDDLWRTEVTQVAQYVKENGEDYNQILVSDIGGKEMILSLAFYQKIDPSFYIQNVKRTEPDAYGLTQPYQLGKYQLGSFSLEELLSSKDLPERTLLITTPGHKKWQPYAEAFIWDRHRVHLLAEIYDIGKLKKKIEGKN